MILNFASMMSTSFGLELKSIKLDDVDIETTYSDIGAHHSEVLLFVHGLGNSLIGFERNTIALSQYYRCIAIDLPGNGFSSKGNYPYGISFFAHIIHSFNRTIGVSKINLVGHSMGGQIAIDFAYYYPTLIKSLILIAPAGIEQFSTIEKSIMLNSMALLDFGMSDYNKLQQALNASFHKMEDHSIELINKMLRLLELQPATHYKKMVNNCIQSMLHEPVWDKIPELNMPVLMIFGEMDALIPNKIFHPYPTKILAEHGIKQFKNGTLKMIPLGGHFIHWEQATVVNIQIHQFINKHLSND